ncbi:MAG: proline racemase family protein [Pirellulaceae bacterium]
MAQQRIKFVDTHTGGEPTRVVHDFPFELDAPTMLQRREQFRQNFDHFRRAIVCEPRGSDVMVGAIITPPVTERSAGGVIFFNNVGYLGMCGHGTIGVAVALLHRNQILAIRNTIDTPVGTIGFDVSPDGRVTLENVPSYRYRHHVPVQLDKTTLIHGDIAWGGNWLFICEDHGLQLDASNIHQLSSFAKRIRRQLDQQGITGADGATVDHVDLIGPPTSPNAADAKNFVLCPGGAYDRSPCGTGTSAKLACLAADGKLAEGAVFRQESIVGSIFECTYRQLENGHILPTITGNAWVNAEGTLLLDSEDPFCFGL